MMSGRQSFWRMVCCLFCTAVATAQPCAKEDAHASACLDNERGSSLFQMSHLKQMRAKAVWEISVPVSMLVATEDVGGTTLAEISAIAEDHPKGGAPPAKPHAVAVPMYIHDKSATDDAENVSGSAISEALGNDLLGDSFSPTHHGVGKKELPGKHGHGHDGHVHHHIALLYFIVDLVFGSIILFFLERCIPNLPYTVALFMAGCVMGFSHFSEWSKHIWPTWWLTVSMWESINPHMLFFGFLPTLIFGEAMRLNAQLVRQSIGQILILACPGVLIGTALTAAFAKYALPYGWNWPIALVFGSTLSATDPVAIVALFNTLGVSPRLTMLISGESLLNDGTAMAIFALMLKVVLGAEISGWGVAIFFAHMTITSVLWGMALGCMVIYFLGMCAEEKRPSDLMLQVITTICAAYLAFFVAESELSTSGVLATVACGYVIALNGWPRFVSREAVATVWEAIEFVGNTVIFFLAGLLFVYNVVQRREYIGARDVMWLFILYIALTLIRGIMVLVLLPFLNCAGIQITKKEAIVMVWSGLRGAVALAMAIIVDREPEIPVETGSIMMFHIGGLAALTTLINATTTAPLLRYLDLTKTTAMKERCLGIIATDIRNDIARKFDEKMAGHEDLRCQGANEDIVRAMVPALMKDIPPECLRSISNDEASLQEHPPAEMTRAQKDDYKQELTQIYRTTFLQVVKKHYWEAIEECMVPKCGLTPRYLLESVDEAMDQTWGAMNDWSALERKLDLGVVNKPESAMSRLVDIWPFSLSSDLRGLYSKERIIERVVNIALTFMEVHSRAQKQVPHLFMGTSREGSATQELDNEASETVIKESQAQFHRVIEVMNILPTISVEVSKSKMLARELLFLQSDRLSFLSKNGFLSDMEVDRLEDEVNLALRKLLHAKHADWLTSKKVDGTSEGLE